MCAVTPPALKSDGGEGRRGEVREPEVPATEHTGAWRQGHQELEARLDGARPCLEKGGWGDGWVDLRSIHDS